MTPIIHTTTFMQTTTRPPQVMVRGEGKGTLPGKVFADALWKAWIGPKPGPGEGFKRGLLGVRS